jgi:uncharacterized protein YkwD
MGELQSASSPNWIDYARKRQSAKTVPNTIGINPVVRKINLTHRDQPGGSWWHYQSDGRLQMSLPMRFFALTLLFLYCEYGAAQTKPAPPAKPEIKISEMEQAVIDLTNEERKKAKLKPLEANPLLFAAARKYAAKMAKLDKLEDEFDNISLADRVQTEKYVYTLAIENIAMGQRTAKQVVAGWMKSEVHRDKILTPGVTEIGVGVEKNAKGQFYWSQIFGTPGK